MATWPQVYGGTPTALSYVPADAPLVQSGHDLADSSEATMGNGAIPAAGTTDFGFVDTTYTLTTAQILKQTTTGQY